MMRNIVIIIPAYNEEVTVKATIAKFHEQMPEAIIYIIDNNSTDNTNRIANETLSEIGCKGKVFFEERQGKGCAIRRAFREIDSDIYVMVDADFTYSPQDIQKLLEPVLKDDADMVIGDRHITGDYAKENKRRFHQFGNIMVRNLINFLFSSNLNDIMSGYRVFNKKFVKNLPILSDGFEIETEMTIHAIDRKFRIVEIPINYQDRPQGSSSKLKTFSDGYRVIKMIFRIFRDYRPFKFFGFLSMLFFIVGTLIGLPPVLEFIKYQFVYKVPSAILATGCMIFSLILFSVGLILDTSVRLYNSNYELRMNDWNSKAGERK
jgi:glycosyltransferase involved in cell wall biosynthesis